MDAGKAKVVKPKPESGERDFFAKALGGEVEIMYCDGSITRGDLLHVGRYTIIIAAGGWEFLVYKHSIASIRRTTGE